MQMFARSLALQARDPRIGLRIAAAMPHGAGGVIEYMMLTAPTLRVMHALYGRFGALLGERGRYEVRELGGYTTMVFLPPPGVRYDPVWEDYRLLRMCNIARRATHEPNLQPTSVRFTYPRPDSICAYHEVFGAGAMLAFDSAEAGIQLPTSMIDRPSPASEPALHDILLRTSERLLGSVITPLTLSERVGRYLVGSLHRGRPNIMDVSRQLGVSERTLRRRLTEEGTSFAELLDKVRASMHATLARERDQSGKHIAGKLGFESTSALRRAEKRWLASGIAPSSAASPRP
jgi:AraC-like DNA-binding protein